MAIATALRQAHNGNSPLARSFWPSRITRRLSMSAANYRLNYESIHKTYPVPQPRMPRRAGEDDKYNGRGGPGERGVRWRVGRAARILRHGAVSADTGPRRAGTAGRR